MRRLRVLLYDGPEPFIAHQTLYDWCQPDQPAKLTNHGAIVELVRVDAPDDEEIEKTFGRLIAQLTIRALVGEEPR